MTHYDITMDHDIAKDAPLWHQAGNDVTRDIHCNITIVNDVAMCIYHGITMHNNIARNLFCYVLLCQVLILLFHQETLNYTRKPLKSISNKY